MYVDYIKNNDKCQSNQGTNNPPLVGEDTGGVSGSLVSSDWETPT